MANALKDRLKKTGQKVKALAKGKTGAFVGGAAVGVLGTLAVQKFMKRSKTGKGAVNRLKNQVQKLSLRVQKARLERKLFREQTKGL